MNLLKGYSRPTLLRTRPRVLGYIPNHPWQMGLAWVAISLAFAFYYASGPNLRLQPVPFAFLVSLGFSAALTLIGMLVSVSLCNERSLWDRAGGAIALLCGLGLWTQIIAYRAF